MTPRGPGSEKGAQPGVTYRLSLTLERAGMGREVRLLIDGRDPLGTGSFATGNHPRDLLDSGALVPSDPPRRIGLYGCGCGIFGCGTLTALVERRGDKIVWRDFYSFSAGEYDGPFHGDSAWPDPVKDPDAADTDLLSPTRLDLPSLTFDAEQYLRVVHEATENWSTAGRRRIEWT